MNETASQRMAAVNDCQNKTSFPDFVGFQQLGQLFQGYLSNSSFKDALVLLSKEGAVLQLDCNCRNLLGYSAEESLGKHLSEFLLPEDAEGFLTFLLEKKTSGRVEKLLYKARKKDGSVCRLRLDIMGLESGNLIALCEELPNTPASGNGKKTSEQVLQALLDNSFDLLALIDEKGQYLYLSESFYDNFEYHPKTNLGYKADDILGTNCFTYMHPDDLPWIMQQFESLFHSERKIYSPPFRFKSAAGDWRWVEAVVTNQLSNPDIEAIIVSCRDITQHVETEHRLKEMQLWEALVNGEEKERSRIAKDLHDGVAGMLAAAKMHLASLQESHCAVATTGAFKQAIQLLEDAATEVRKTSHNLMPELLLQHGLDEALRRFCCNISNDNLQVRYDSWGTLIRYKSSFELSVYRVVQELLNNVVRHSQASEVLVQFHSQDSILYITVEDNGIGMSEEQKSKEGMGLSNLQARVNTINGRLEIVTEIGEGVSAYLEFDTSNWKKNPELAS